MSELSGKYPAKLHAKSVVDILKKKDPSTSGLIYLEGQKTRLIEDNDEPVPFRQRRFFFYLSGFPLPDASLTYDIDSEKLTLFIPPIDKDEVMWTGLPLTKEEALTKYDADEVLYSNEVENHLFSAGKAIHALPHNEATFLQSSSTTFKIDTSLLKDAIETARIFKSSYEIAIMKRANEISKIAHESVMAAVSKASNERELEAIFIEKSIANGGRNQAYHSILASGTNAATLHYQKNDQPLKGRLNLLIDAGAEYDCYASDITRTFPISGEFTKESREVYDVVLHMQKECTEMLKGGIKWDDVHYHAHKVAVDGLLKIGILKGDAQEILDKRTSVAFFPHGLGHYLGLDTHDTGGNPNYKDEDSMFRYLRIRGNIPAGSVVTVEPGVYFCEFIIKPYLEDPKHNAHIDEKVLEKYWAVGGVRIEDNVLITESGYENLTNVPKEVDDMQRIIRS